MANFVASDGLGVSMRTPRGNPFFCGGSYSPGNSCYEYLSESDTWAPGPNMTEDRELSAVVELPNGTFWILGGYYNKRTTEIYEDGEFFQGPDLPEDFSGDTPCATQITDDLTFIGSDSFGYLYSATTGAFEKTADPMPNSADTAACGSATLANGNRVVVVAGGNYGNTLDESASMIYDITTNQWTDGPELPFPLRSARVVPTENAFLVMGGYNRRAGGGIYFDYFDTIFEFDPLNMAWIEREQKLQRPLYGFWVINVEKERFC